jgi:predicted aspartyl protease
MIVDTGATSHAITAWFASKHGLPLSPAAGSATDHAGRAVRMFRTEAAVVTLDGWGSLGTGPFLVYEMPEIIERLGVGMFVAPQALVEEGRAVVLDLAARELRMEPVVDALRARAGTPLPAAKACVEAGSIRGLSYVVPAKIGGHDARLLVDTGAQHTDLFESSKAGKALAASATAGDDKTWGASGRIRSRRVEGAAVALGDHAARVNVDILPGAAPAGACPRDGVLAMDALAGCVLVFAGDELATTCASSLGP